MTTQIQINELVCVPSVSLKETLVRHAVDAIVAHRNAEAAKLEVIRDFVPTVRTGFINQLNSLVENGLNDEKDIAVRIDGSNIALKEHVLTEAFGVVKSTLADQFGPAGYKVSFESLGGREYKFVLHPNFEFSDINTLAEQRVNEACTTGRPTVGDLLIRAIMS